LAQRSFLGDMLTTLFERNWTGSGQNDSRSIEEMCLALLDAEGEVSGISLAQAILDRYAHLEIADKAVFFAFLNDQLEVDTGALQQAIGAYNATNSIEDYRQIGALAEPRRQELLRRLNQSPGATQALVNMRADLLRAVRTDPDLRRTDIDFQHLLRSWFNRGFLVLRQISWETPAHILEKIVEYEAVHAIDDWDDLRRRLFPSDRRCFAYFHPSMPDEPLIFVEVALTQEVPNSIQRVLADDRETRAASDTSVAVFYSISNCQAGLMGISFGNLLIKQVVMELQQALPGLETFVTLSPIPKLRAWQAAQPDVTPDPDSPRLDAIDYLTQAKTDAGAPFDPVARFHLGNGAQIYAVHDGADLSPKGLDQSHGTMVNYQYDLASIEQNHERFVQSGEVCLAPGFRSDLSSLNKRRKAKVS